MPVYAAHLRVYEPLAAFDGAERDHWESYLRAGGGVSRGDGTALERAASFAAIAARRPVLPCPPEHAYVTGVDGLTLLCPLRSELRCAEAVVDFADLVPEEAVAAFLPGDLVDQAERSLERLQSSRADLRGHIRTCTWQVPVRWFILVEAEERRVRLGTGPGDAPARTGRELLYRTPMSRARRRAARALAVLRGALPDSPAADDVEDLGRWLEEFHPRAMVELDYGDLVYLLDDAELRQDESAQDVGEALSALGSGETERAVAAYTRVAGRMKALADLETAN